MRYTFLFLFLFLYLYHQVHHQGLWTPNWFKVWELGILSIKRNIHKLVSLYTQISIKKTPIIITHDYLQINALTHYLIGIKVMVIVRVRVRWQKAIIARVIVRIAKENA